MTIEIYTCRDGNFLILRQIKYFLNGTLDNREKYVIFLMEYILTTYTSFLGGFGGRWIKLILKQ
jgi:hypothetical protein